MSEAADDPQALQAALQALARRHRHDLQHELQQLQRMFAASRTLTPLLRRSLPLLPYVATTASVALLVVLLRRRGAPPSLLAAGATLDALRVWMLLRRPGG